MKNETRGSFPISFYFFVCFSVIAIAIFKYIR